MRFAKWVFRIAGVYGLLVTVPLAFLERKIGLDQPPAITHPEYFYGFIGVVIAWQVAFLILSTDPRRYRPLMIAAVLEKAGFAVAVPVLVALGRTPAVALAPASIDAVLGVCFAVAFVKTRPISDRIPREK